MTRKTTFENAAKLVTILMGMRDGAAFLPDQLTSLAAQSHLNWQLWCSDDGSEDGSVRIVRSFAQRHPQRIRVTHGPRKGFAQNFLSLMRTLPHDTGPVALCDQDDIWLPDKLTRAIAMLAKAESTPTHYCARAGYWNGSKEPKTISPQRTRPCTFANALVENIATGNTIVLNASAARLARLAGQYAGGVCAHDVWLYLLNTGTGGKVIFDNVTPPILYRQHDANAIGAPTGLLPHLRRKMSVLQGVYAERVNANITAIWRVRDLLTPAAKATLDEFIAAREGSTPKRLYQLSKSGAYRHGLGGTIGLWGAASLGKI